MGQCNIPASATGVSMNVTIVEPTASSFLTIFPADQTTPPLASNLNWTAGQGATPNKVDVRLSLGGAIKLFNHTGTVNVLADVVGYYAKAGLADLQNQFDAVRTQTVEISGFTMTGVGSTDPQIGVIGNCANVTRDYFGWVSLPVPRGATIVNVTAHIYDEAATGTLYSLILYRVTTSAAGDSFSEIATAGGGELSAATADKDLTPIASTEVANPGERFLVRLFDGSLAIGGGSGLCGVTLTYRLATP